jgi:hypothetical protein
VKVTISGNTSYPAAGAFSNTNLWQLGKNGESNIFLMDGFGGAPIIVGRASEGTTTSQSNVGNGAGLLVLQGHGYGATNYSTSQRAVMEFTASETWTDAANGTYIAFWTTQNTTAVPVERLRIDNAGNVGIGNTPSGSFKLQVSGSGSFSSLTISTSLTISASTMSRANGDFYIIGGGSQLTRNSLILSNNGGPILWGGSATNNSPSTTGVYGIRLAGGDGNVTVINSSDTTSITSGSFVVSGGVGVAKSLNVGGTIQVNSKQAVNGPAFSAYPSSSVTQTILSNGTQQKILFQNEEFDTDNNFASSRFTPTVAGYYQLNAVARISGTLGTGESMLVIWKNGAEYKRGSNASGTELGASFFAMQVSALVYANGTGDYFEVYIQQSSGGSRDITVAHSPGFGNITWFNGCMVRGA